MHLPSLALTGLATAAAVTNLYVSSYSGDVTTLHLSALSKGGYSLTTSSTNPSCSLSPTWLTKDEKNGIIYCLDEGIYTPNGSITSFKTSQNGTLTKLDRLTTINGPVSSVIFNNGQGMAAAYYGGSSVSSWAINSNGSLTPTSSFTYSLPHPGPKPPQVASHPHEVILDPTGEYIVVPDLGADLLRVFQTSHSHPSLLTPSITFSVPLGSGPRHGTFLQASGGETYFFLLSELSSEVSSYLTTYNPNSTLTFTLISRTSIYGPHQPQSQPVGATAAAEAILSPCGHFLLTSSRNDSLFTIPNFNPLNSTRLPSDTLQTWAIDHATGKLEFRQLAPAGGMFPRQFSLNRNGTLAAVAVQNDERVVIIERRSDGMFGDFVASVDVPGQVTSVIWDE